MEIKKQVKKALHILNPLAGKGTAKKVKEGLNSDDVVYMSESPEETTEFIKKSCKENPESCFTVYGGDGTVFRAVNALMDSGCAEKASLKVVPIGSGNDFVRSFEGVHGETKIDLLTVNGRYAANLVNMGFDCSVVKRAVKLKKNPFVPNKLAYKFGVIGEFFSKKPMDAKITVTYADGEEEHYEGKFLLIAAGNCNWYGGGYKVCPAAKYDDGLIDLVIVKDVTRRTFLGLVGDYKKGTYVDNETGAVSERFKDFVIYKKCVKVKIVGCGSVCADGEIFAENEVEIGIKPKALTIITD